MNCMCRAT